ncbi:NADPH-dependent F420 reductase, partial [Bifidobacterium sp.]|uniref:NADPH-dependent F420 reductase n=1 Tax=Bifidobacterium sp. TaxID=41200 RepID=UPI002A910C7A
MATITIFGTGNMGTAIKSVFEDAGATVQSLDSHSENPTIEGDIVVLAVPYPALASIAEQYGDQLEGKTVVDITNPLDFSTFDSLVVPADSSAAAELQAKLPKSHVLKAFNTVFAANIASKKTGDAQSTVLVAGDDDAAKAAFIDLVKAGGLDAIDAGALKRARELEAFGFLQLALAMQKKISFTAG